MDIARLEAEITALAEQVRGSRIPDERLDISIDLAGHREPGIALEILCENIEEFDVAVPASFIARVARIGREMNLDERYWSRLQITVEA